MRRDAGRLAVRISSHTNRLQSVSRPFFFFSSIVVIVKSEVGQFSKCNTFLIQDHLRIKFLKIIPLKGFYNNIFNGFSSFFPH